MENNLKKQGTGASLFLDKEPSSESTSNQIRTGFILPSIEGDQQIYLGQSIIALITLNQSLYYSDKMNNDFLKELFVGLINHFKLDYKELYELNLKMNILDPNYDYDLDIILKHTILKQEER